MKNITLWLTAVYFMVLLAVPGYMIYRQHDILLNGETYKIMVGAYDPYDPFRGRYVTIRPALAELRWPDTYVRLEKNAADFVTAAYVAEKIGEPGVVKHLTLERYYMNENSAPRIEEYQLHALDENDEMYVSIKVKNGGYAVEGLYINGIAAEDFITP